MIVKEFIELLSRPVLLEIDSEEKRMICITITDSEGIEPYLNRDIIKWGLPHLEAINPHLRPDIWIRLKDENIYRLAEK